MAELVWDKVGDRVYETGLDRGVLYLPDGSAVPWNGLTSVVESVDKESSPVYFDGMKINDFVTLGSFQASMKAVTYPDEFVELEGLDGPRKGLFYADQIPQSFGLCYRTMIGNDVDGDDGGYKIHIIYNVTAVPKDKTYATASSEPSLVEFEWDISAVPEEIPGFRPTAHIIINTKDIDPLLLEDLEDILYGGPFVNANLIPLPQLTTMINDFFRFEIRDNGDGTWMAQTDIEDFVILGPETGYFQLLGINAWYLDNETYVTKSTKGVSDVPQIRIHDVGNGTWTAHSEYNPLIVQVEPGMYDIFNANTETIDANTYLISDTPED